MATPAVRELSYGAIDIFTQEILGVGSYGKVCKAKCDQLPCAAKLLHDTMFGNNDQGTLKFVENFEKECHFLRMIKHPNIVQFLGTVRDPQSQRLAIVIELMDESLTRFLERPTGPLSYHTQLNICHDVALALAYLHGNNIIHRDLSSNNVLLIGEGSRAKVTDFGMSKLESMNPRMTPLTLCPGTHAYMPPEALGDSPYYSNNIDCFSHGVLAIQIVTRKFPNPTGRIRTKSEKDTKFPTGIIHVLLPEKVRRKEDIDLVDPNHPLLPLALHCLKDRDTERPTADELCGRLATLKGEQMYTRSVEQSREQNISLRTLQEQKAALDRARANHSIELRACQQQIEDAKRASLNYRQRLQEKDDELEKARASHQHDNEIQEYQRKLRALNAELERVRDNHMHESELQQKLREKDCQIQQMREENKETLQALNAELKKAKVNRESEVDACQRKLREKDRRIQEMREEFSKELNNKEAEMNDYFQAQVQTQEGKIEQLQKEIQELRQKQTKVAPQPKKKPQSKPKVATPATATPAASLLKAPADPVKLQWRRGKPAPENLCGAAVAHGHKAYFSLGNNVYLYTIAEDKWAELEQCENKSFSMAVINDRLTAIGGECDQMATNALLCLSADKKWERFLPSMQANRIWSAAVTTPTHLIVAGGMTEPLGGELSSVEILDLNTLQWFSASSSPEAFSDPNMVFCDGRLYLSEHNKVYSCSIEELLKSSQLASVWTKLADIPVLYYASLTTLGDRVLVVGGKDKLTRGTATGTIHCYEKKTNSWTQVGDMPTPRSCALVAVLSSNELVVVGGEGCDATEIATPIK